MISILQTSKKDRYYRKLYKTSEMERRYYKFLKITSLSLGVVPLLNLGKIRIRNHCLITGKPRGVYSKRYRLSRHQIKAYFQYITGLRGSSW